MIYSVKLGNPIDTEAVVDSSEINELNDTEFIEKIGAIGGELHINSTDGLPEVVFKYHMDDNTSIYGLGETEHGINKRGFKYVSDNTDEPHHTEDKTSLYGSHNFFVVRDKESEFGMFFDYPSVMEFDMGYESRSWIKVSVPEAEVVIYLITGASVYDIVKQFRGIIGKSYTAPFWAFGYGQSRWGYKNANDIREVVNGYRNAGIPLDMVYMDIDYMEDYKDFTINRDRFPKFSSFVTEMEEQGIHLVPIIDAGVKVETDYDVYEEGKSLGYFCTNDDSTLFQAAVWPGMTHFVDFFKPEARKWFGLKYAALTDYGIEGFWNDMNEPAIFYTEDTLERTRELIANLRFEDEIKVEDIEEIGRSIEDWRSHEVYKHFFHQINKKKVAHDKVHNLYGYLMTRAAAEGLEELLPDKRLLLFSRSSYIGMHRYSGIWTGDNMSWWSHLEMNLHMLPGLNMCGFLYSGADIGGFGGNTNEELLMRWIALGIFTPLFRNHCAIGGRDQECYRFEDIEGFKNIISIRYRLLPYLYSEYLKSVNDNLMYFRPLVFDYEDDFEAANVEDQLLLGEGLMIAPVIKENAKGRYIYLPEDMLFIKFINEAEYSTTVMTKGHHYIECGLREVPLFLKKGNMLPLYGANVCTADMGRYLDKGSLGTLKADDFEIIVFPEDRPSYELLCEKDKQLVSNNLFIGD